MSKKTSKSRKFRAWYTHEVLELSLDSIKELAESQGVELDDTENPTQE